MQLMHMLVNKKIETEEKKSYRKRVLTIYSPFMIRRLFNEYSSTTPQKLKLVDAYLAYIMLTRIFQFLYCLLVGTFPFNSFLSGFISCVGSFVLAGTQDAYIFLVCEVYAACAVEHKMKINRLSHIFIIGSKVYPGIQPSTV